MLPKAAVEKFLQGLSEPIKAEMHKHVEDIYKELNVQLRKVQTMQGQLSVAIHALEDQHKENEKKWESLKSS